MIKKIAAYAALCLLTFINISFATVPNSGIFVGLGGSYNSVKLDQNLFASGVSNVYSGSTLVAYGQAGGPANPFHNTQTTFAPEAQVGYFRHFTDSNWLWGAKFFYEYLGITTTHNNILAPQVGSFTNTNVAPAASNTSFTGNVVIQSSQTNVTNELALMPFVGHSITHGFVYFGAGPVVFDTQSDLYQATGYADINGTHADITGTADNFFNSKWVWGGGAQIGMTYFLAHACFLDLNYLYAVTKRFTINNTAPFSSETEGFTDTGTLFVSNSQRETVQAVTVSINKIF